MKRIFQLTQKIGTWLSKGSQESESPLLLQSLEDRVLYSAVPLPVENIDVPAEAFDVDDVDFSGIESNTTFVFVEDDAEISAAQFPASELDVTESYSATDDVEATLADLDQLVNSLEESDDTSTENEELVTAAGIATATPDDNSPNFFELDEGQSFIIDADFLGDRSAIYSFGFRLVTEPTNGTLLNGGVKLAAGDDVMRSAIDADEVIFVPDTSFVGNLNFTISTSGPFALFSDTFTIRYDGVADDGIVTIGETFNPTDGSSPLFDTTNGDPKPQITALDDGGYVVVTALDNNEGDLKFQRFDNDGIATSSEVVVDTVHFNVENVAITNLSDGGFLVAYEGEDSSGKHITIRQYGGDDQPVDFGNQGAELSPAGEINTDGISIEFLGEEFFTVTYVDEVDSSIHNIVYNLDGSIEQTFTITVGANFSNESVQTELLGDGSYAVAWVEIEDSASNASKIKAAIFDPGGHLRVSEFELFAGTGITDVSIAATPETGFVVAWQGTDSDPAGIYAAKFDTLGTPLSIALVAQGSTTTEATPDIAVLADGSFVISYTTVDENGTDEILGQRLNESLETTGEVFNVNSFSRGDQSNSELALLNNGTLASTFISTDATDTATIFHQRLSMAAVGNENSLIPLTTLIGVDSNSTTEVIELIEVSGLPIGSEITTNTLDADGNPDSKIVFTADDVLIFNEMDISELFFTGPSNTSGTFDATIKLTTNDGGDRNEIETDFRIVLNSVIVDVLNENTIIPADEDTSLVLSQAEFITNFITDGQSPDDLVNLISNVDFSEADFEDYVEWSPSPTSGIQSSFLFDGTETLTAELPGIADAASFEFWIRPEDFVGNDRIIAQFGDENKGFTLLQNQGEVILRFKVVGSDVFELRADGLIGQPNTGSYDQIVVYI